MRVSRGLHRPLLLGELRLLELVGQLGARDLRAAHLRTRTGTDFDTDAEWPRRRQPAERGREVVGFWPSLSQSHLQAKSEFQVHGQPQKASHVRSRRCRRERLPSSECLGSALQEHLCPPHVCPVYFAESTLMHFTNIRFSLHKITWIRGLFFCFFITR